MGAAMSDPVSPAARSSIDVALLAVPANSASGLFGMRDVLNSVGVGWETYVTGSAPAPSFRVSIVGARRTPFVCASGALIEPDHALADAPTPDVIIASGMFVSAVERIAGIDPAVIAWLAERHAAGTTIASSCTGAILLAEAGLLDGVEATTHWAFYDLFRTHYPKVHLRLEQNLCCVPPDHRIVTSGGTTMWQELALYLIARFIGVEQATRTAKFWLLPNRERLQAPYVAMPKGIPHHDAQIAAAQSWIATHYATPDPVTRLAERSGLAMTTFRRRFAAATGFQPMDYIHTVRVEEAKQLLETTRLTVADVASQVGYEDLSYFTKLFRRRTGLSPADHRRKFGAERFRRYLEGQ
jgi:transcriptional regulator GlxA family with amidase domain